MKDQNFLKSLFRYCSAIVFILLLSFSNAAAQKSLMEILSENLKNGSVDEIIELFDGTVNLSINGVIGSYSKNQANALLHDFFSKNKPQSLNVESNNETIGEPIVLGYLNTSNGKFHVYITLKEMGVLKDLRFDK